MRLIDADALKEKLGDTRDGKPVFRHTEFIRMDVLEEAIDKAPTIKTFTLVDIEEQYRKGLEKGLEEARLHGEWKHDQFGDFLKSVSCSNCGLQSAFEFPFCPSCGTKMHKGGEVK